MTNELDQDWQPKINTEQFRVAKGKAIALVRECHQIPIEAIDGLTTLEVQDIESGKIWIGRVDYLCYSNAIGISLDEFLNEVAEKTNIEGVFKK